ncbi:MAG: sigma 54-interacting transcriptional regulator [Firmicutes bacterium]|nr:sigma 54-interacting transcriptional regulator [Bacillota bacterium]
MKLIKEISEKTVDILENFFDNIMIYNCEGKLLYACEKFWRDTKLNPEEFCGKTIADISTLGIYKPCAGEIAYQTKDRITIVQRAFLDEISVVTALPVKDKNGEIFLYITYAENNDKIIELEDKLDQMNQYIIEKDKELIEIISHKFLSNEYTGKNNQVLKVQKLIERIADFDANVLLMGETGVGKTTHAEKIHSKGKRRDLPFIEINCAAIPETLLESELFGYEKGAFTGGQRKRKNRSDRASKWRDSISR